MTRLDAGQCRRYGFAPICTPCATTRTVVPDFAPLGEAGRGPDWCHWCGAEIVGPVYVRDHVCTPECAGWSTAAIDEGRCGDCGHQAHGIDPCPEVAVPMHPSPNPTCTVCEPHPGDPCVCGWDG